jgi:hypothetical protein
VYPKTRTVEVYVSPRAPSLLREDDVLDGGKALPGLRIPVKSLFANLKRGE